MEHKNTKETKKQKFVNKFTEIIDRHPFISVLIGVLIITIIIPLAINWGPIGSECYSKAGNDGWASFWGSYLGGIFGGAGTLIAVIVTTGQAKKHQQENLKETRKIQNENFKQIKIQNINEKIKDCSDLHDAINEADNVLLNIYINYNRKEQWILEDIQGILKEINKVNDQISKIGKNPLMLIMGCNTDSIIEQYRKIIELLKEESLSNNHNNSLEQIKNLITCLDETSEKIKIYIKDLYEKKYSSLEI